MREKRFVLTEYGVRADTKELQTTAIQSVLDLCRGEGGTVIVPAGEFRISSLRMWSDTTLVLLDGARLVGSEECEDYEVYDVPDGVELRTDMEMITQYYGKPWATYRRAMISAYGERNISIVGEGNALIDGKNCYDANGEEGYRGPHGIFLTNCSNIVLRGYTVAHSGNFMHQLDNCRNTEMRGVTCLGGSDAVHLHCCEDTLIEDCVFHTGDDCIAGINIRNLTVRRCELNTSCNVSRIGGVHIHFENCRIWGPGIYPHRMTVVLGKGEELPQEAGRHNMLFLMDYFASENYPDSEPSHDIVFKDCSIENIEWLLNYRAGMPPLQKGTYLSELILERVTITGLGAPCSPLATDEVPLSIILHDTKISFRDGQMHSLTDGADVNTKITVV